MKSRSWIGRTLSLVPVLLIAVVGPTVIGAATAGASLPTDASYGTGSTMSFRIGALGFSTINLSGLKSGALTTSSGKYKGTFLTASTRTAKGTGFTATITGTVELIHSGTTISGVVIHGMSILLHNGGVTHCKLTGFPNLTFGYSAGKWQGSATIKVVRATTSGGTCADKSYFDTATIVKTMQSTLTIS